MGENLDLKTKYEKKLADAGMPEKLDPIAIPRDGALEKIILDSPELKDYMLKFKSFSEEIKTYIADQVLKLREDGLPKEEIIHRLKLLVDKLQDFTVLDGSDSDKKHIPNINTQDQEMRDLEVFAEAGAAGHIDRAEKIIEKEKPKIIH